MRTIDSPIESMDNKKNNMDLQKRCETCIKFVKDEMHGNLQYLYNETKIVMHFIRQWRIMNRMRIEACRHSRTHKASESPQTDPPYWTYRKLGRHAARATLHWLDHLFHLPRMHFYCSFKLAVTANFNRGIYELPVLVKINENLNEWTNKSIYSLCYMSYGLAIKEI
jgi:hypothetical protein